jgi:hypothetical protein
VGVAASRARSWKRSAGWKRNS